jgi:predicted permease
MPRFRFPFTTPRQLHRDIDDELATHLSLSTEAHEARGHTPAEARALAEARLGDLGHLHRALYHIDRLSDREKRTMTWLTDLIHDLRFSLRRVRRRPLLFVLILLTLAIGTGTVMTFFGAADAILLRPLPIAEPDRVMTLWRAPVASPTLRTGLATGTIMDLVEESRTFATIAAAEPYGYDIVHEGQAHSVGAWHVTEGFFDVLRMPPFAGRLLEQPDFVPGGPPVVVVTHGFFHARLGGDLAAVGRTTLLDGNPHRVVGVLPPDFPLIEGRELYTPKVISGEEREVRRSDYLPTFGRLQAGVEPAAAAAEMRELARRSDARIVGPQTERELQVVPVVDAMLGEARTGLGLLALGAILLLLMAAANAAGLMVADTLDRHRELTIRASVGAGRGRIIRQLLTEAAVLSIAAGAVGFGLGVLGLRAFQRLAPADLPRLAELVIDVRLVAIVAGAVLLLAAVIGILPARLVARSDLQGSLKDAEGTAGGRAGRRTRLVLVGTQVALASILLGAGGLLVRSWMQLQSEDQGYQARGLMAIEQHIWQRFTTSEARANFAVAAVDQLRTQPGVVAAALASSLPLAPDVGADQARVRRPGVAQEFSVRATVGTPGLFETLEIPLVQGRSFSSTDRADGERVVIVSRTAAATLFPVEDPVGQAVDVAFMGPPVPGRIIGVVGDVRFGSPSVPEGPAVYLAHTQAPTGSVYIVTRHTEVTPATVNSAQQAVVELMPGAALEGAIDLGALLQAANSPRRFAMLLLTAFAATALALTAVGLFGLLAQSVRGRRQELGVRMAVGAWPTSLRNMVVSEGLRLAGTGLAAGLALLLLGSGLFRRVLYGVPVHDPLTLIGVVILVLAVATAASWWPALQATRVDPIQALRRE